MKTNGFGLAIRKLEIIIKEPRIKYTKNYDKIIKSKLLFNSLD